MLHGSSILASRREERVQKAALVDHHGPGDARLSHSAIGLYGEQSDYVQGPPPTPAFGFAGLFWVAGGPKGEKVETEGGPPFRL